MALRAAYERFTVVCMGESADKAGHVYSPCSRRTYTSYDDAVRVAQRRSHSRSTDKPCFVLHGLPGVEKLTDRCFKYRCRPPKAGDLEALQRCGISKKQRKTLIAARALRGRREPPPVYHPRMGPPPGVPMPPKKSLGWARRRRRK